VKIPDEIGPPEDAFSDDMKRIKKITGNAGAVVARQVLNSAGGACCTRANRQSKVEIGCRIVEQRKYNVWKERWLN
jgi:hypothetical protein